MLADTPWLHEYFLEEKRKSRLPAKDFPGAENVFDGLCLRAGLVWSGFCLN